MKSNRILIILLVFMVGYNIIITKKLSDNFNRTKSGLIIGGLSMVENLSDLILFKYDLQKGKNIDEEKTNLSTYFKVYQLADSSRNEYMFISKHHDDLVYLINKDTMIYYDKIVYDFNEKLKVGYRIKFHEWLYNDSN